MFGACVFCCVSLCVHVPVIYYPWFAPLFLLCVLAAWFKCFCVFHCVLDVSHVCGVCSCFLLLLLSCRVVSGSLLFVLLRCCVIVVFCFFVSLTGCLFVVCLLLLLSFLLCVLRMVYSLCFLVFVFLCVRCFSVGCPSRCSKCVVLRVALCFCVLDCVLVCDLCLCVCSCCFGLLLLSFVWVCVVCVCCVCVCGVLCVCYCVLLVCVVVVCSCPALVFVVVCVIVCLFMCLCSCLLLLCVCAIVPFVCVFLLRYSFFFGCYRLCVSCYFGVRMFWCISLLFGPPFSCCVVLRCVLGLTCFCVR